MLARLGQAVEEVAAIGLVCGCGTMRGANQVGPQRLGVLGDIGFSGRDCEGVELDWVASVLGPVFRLLPPL